MTTAMLEATGEVECVQLSDGLLVRLRGTLGEPQLTPMRHALLGPLADDCRDIVVDAADVTDVDDAALAVLLAGRVWAEDHGARFMLSRSATALDACLDTLGLVDALPRLSTLAPHEEMPLIPLPRHSVD